MKYQGKRRFVATIDRLESRDLQTVIHPVASARMLNPQPLPPVAIVSHVTVSARALARPLNPQPLPP